jgi:hypothetical protein
MSWRGAVKAGTDTAVDILKEDAKATRAAELYQTKRQNSMTDAMETFKQKAKFTADATTGVLDSNYGYKNLKEFDTQINAQAKAAIGQAAVGGYGKLKGKDITKNAWDKSAHAAELSKVYKAAYSNGMKNLTLPTLSNKMLAEAKINHDRKIKNKWVTSILGDYKDPTLAGLRGNIPMESVSGKIAIQQRIDDIISGTSTIDQKKAQLIKIKTLWESHTGTKWEQH